MVLTSIGNNILNYIANMKNTLNGLQRTNGDFDGPECNVYTPSEAELTNIMLLDMLEALKTVVQDFKITLKRLQREKDDAQQRSDQQK